MRSPWDRYFMDIAGVVAMRSTCNKRQVGCVVVANKIILSTGYNGSIKGAPHCDDVGCLLDLNRNCVRTVHAEANAIAQAAGTGGRLWGATAYCTYRPCWTCYKLLANAGIMRVVYLKEGGDAYDSLAPNMVLIHLERGVETRR